MRKMNQSYGRSEKRFKHQSKSEYLVEYFERMGRRGQFDSVEFHARYKDLGYVPVEHNEWPTILNGINNIWMASNRKTRDEIAMRVRLPTTLDVICHVTSAFTDADDIVAAMKFCGIARDTKTNTLFEKLEKNIEPLARRMHAPDMTGLLVAYMRQDIFPSSKIVDALGKISADYFSELDTNGFYDVTRASAQLGLRLPAMSAAIGDAVPAHAHLIEPTKQDGFLWALAALHAGAPNGALADAAREAYTISRINTPSVHHAFCRWFDIPLQKENLNFDTAPSAPERKLTPIFQAAGARILPNTDPRTKHFMPPSDLRVSFGGKDFAIEYDGIESHMRKNTQGGLHYTGATLFNAALRAKFTPDTFNVHIDSTNYQTLFRVAGTYPGTLARSLLEQAVELQPGTYTARIGEHVRLNPL